MIPAGALFRAAPQGQRVLGLHGLEDGFDVVGAGALLAGQGLILSDARGAVRQLGAYRFRDGSSEGLSHHGLHMCTQVASGGPCPFSRNLTHPLQPVDTCGLVTSNPDSPDGERTAGTALTLTEGAAAMRYAATYFIPIWA